MPRGHEPWEPNVGAVATSGGLERPSAPTSALTESVGRRRPTHRWFSWAVGAGASGNMSIVSAPGAATVDAYGDVHLRFSGLAAATRYLGQIAYGGTAGHHAPTSVLVITP